MRMLWNIYLVYNVCHYFHSHTTHLLWSFYCLAAILNLVYRLSEELWRITKQKPIEIQIKRRKWNWIGHTLRKEAGVREKTALYWNPQGYRRRSRPKRTWQWTIEDEIRNTGRLWNEVKGIAGDCNAWKLFMDAVFSTRSKRNWWWWWWWWWYRLSSGLLYKNKNINRL